MPAGNYALECDLSDNNFDGDPNAYLMVTAGTEISDIEDISTAVAGTRVGGAAHDVRAGARNYGVDRPRPYL